MPRLLTLIAALALAALGCDPDDSQRDGDSAEIIEDVGALPEFDVSIEASRLAGNVPLDVTFEALVTGVDPAELELSWLVNDNPAGSGVTFESRFLFAGQITVTLQATYRRSDGETKVDTASIIIGARACADLEFDRFTIAAPSDLPPGGTLTVGAGNLLNKGDAITDAFTVGVGLSTDALWDPTSDILLVGASIPSMPSGFASESQISMVGRTFALPADIAEGSYFAFLVADTGDAINECEEADNQKVATNNLAVDVDAGKLANLRMEEITVSPSVVSQGAIVAYKFKLINDGDADARNFRHAFWLSADQVLDPTTDRPLELASDQGAKVQTLGAGATLGFLKSYTVPADLPDGTYWVIGMVDAQETVPELDEGDNLAIAATQLTMEFEAPDCADLALTRVIVSPLSTYWGGSVRMQVTVQNPGTKPIPDNWLFRAYLSLSPSFSPSQAFVVGTYPMGGVAAGEEEVYELILPISDDLPVSDHYFAGYADPTSSIVECTETNNTRLFGEKVHIAGQASIDVAVERFDYHPPFVEAGEVIKVEYDITNHGTAAATSFQVAVVMSPDAVISREGIAAGLDVVIDRLTVTGLDPGQLQTQVRDVVVPTGLDHRVETYRVGVLADVDGFLTSDTSISNNLRYADTPLVVTGATGGCFEDLNENDDVRADATDVDPASGPVVMQDLGSCGDSDWFEVVVPQGHSLIVDVDASPIVAVPAVTANLAVELVDPAGAVAQRATFGPRYEVRAFAVPSIGTWAVRVSGASATDRASYDIRLATLPPQTGIDVVAYDVRPAPATSYPGGRLAIAWREVNLGTISAGIRTTRVWLSKDRLLDPNDLALGELASAPLAPGVTFARDTTVQVPSNVPGGSWYLVVEADADGDVLEVDEDNNLSAGGPIALDPLKVCNDDVREPNDEQGIATLLSDGDRVSDAVVCPSLDDWYAIDLEAGEAFEAEVAYPYDPSKGKMVLELWDPQGQAALITDSRTSSLRVALPSAWESGRWLLRVANEPGPLTAPYTYELTVEVSPGPIAAYCEADRYEPDNTQAHAVGIGCGLVVGTLCNLDLDWYVVQGRVAQRIDITLTNTKSEIYAKLYVPGGTNPVATIYGSGTTGYTPAGTGPLLLKLEPRSGPTSMTAFAYTLKVSGLDGADLALESLTSPFQAVDRGEDAGVALTIKNQCTAASTPFEVAAYLSIDDALGTDDVALGTWPVDAIAAATTVMLEPKVTVPLSTMPGWYWLVVQADSGEVVPEGNEVDNVLALPLEVREPCLPDAEEPNDTRGASGLVPLPGEVSGVAICPNDQDWYAVTAEAGDRVRIDALFEHADGDLDLRVYAGISATPIATSQSTDDDESVVIDVPVATTLYLRVAGYADASAAYELFVTLE